MELGYVKFVARDWGYAGDRGSWAYIDAVGGVVMITVKRADKGIISRKYEAELSQFCREHGIDWNAIPCGGQTVAVKE